MKKIHINLFAGLFLSILLSVGILAIGDQDITDKAINSFHTEATISNREIMINVDKYSTLMNTLHAFIQSHSELKQDDFDSYFTALGADVNYPDLTYLGYTYKRNGVREEQLQYLNKTSYMVPERDALSKYATNRVYLSMKKDGTPFWALEYRLPVVKDEVHLYEIRGIVDFGRVVHSTLVNTSRFSRISSTINEHYKEFNQNIVDVSPFSETMYFLLDGREKEIILFAENPKSYYAGTRILIGFSILAGILAFILWMFYGRLWNAEKMAARLADIANQELTQLAWYDSLTGIFNRAKCLKNIEEKIKDDKNFSLFFIDLDGFKRVNDTLGHQAGDLVLIEYASRLQNLLPSKYMLSRVGGDEFVLMAENNKSSVEEIAGLVSEIYKASQKPFVVGNYKFSLSQSIGVSNYPIDGQDSETILRKADVAMYIAKKSDTKNHIIYSEEVGNKLIEKNKMESDLLESIKNNELYLVFQPKMKKIGSAYKIVGMEALTRWHSPTWGMVSPEIFIDIAEQNGFIDTMTTWLLHRVCDNITDWKKNHAIDLPISINLSGRQFLNPKLGQELLDIIQEHNVETKNIVVEITESTIMKQPETATKIISMLRDHGIKVSMDDFGTGYSSFGYLSRFTIDEIKIDKSFINRANKSALDRSVVEAIVSMAHKLNLSVIAEGVETMEDVEFLSSIDCHDYQGFFFSKPLAEADLIDFYRKNSIANT